MTKETGVPAFPSTSYWDARDGTYRPTESDGGMSLRDYFAAKAMQPLLVEFINNAESWASAASGCAKASYQVADAMLEARK